MVVDALLGVAHRPSVAFFRSRNASSLAWGVGAASLPFTGSDGGETFPALSGIPAHVMLPGETFALGTCDGGNAFAAHGLVLQLFRGTT